MRRSQLALIVFATILLSIVGVLAWQKFMLSPQPAPISDKPMGANGVVQDDSGKTVEYWYDPMVPNQKFDKPGKSPFMDMMLEPKYASEGEAGGNEGGVSIPAQSVQNLGIRVAPVRMASFGDDLAAVG